jgi:hypothetical protein
MTPAAAATTSFAAAATVAAPTAPFRACVRLPLRGGPGAPRRAVASMAVSTPRSAAAASFLERRESERALHFVKYQGLGNDFIMVRVFRFYFLCLDFLQQSYPEPEVFVLGEICRYEFVQPMSFYMHLSSYFCCFPSDFCVDFQVDNRDSSVPKVTPEEAAKLCDRNFGIGADGVIFVMPGSNGADYTMRIFNSDGSEPEVRAPKFHHILNSLAPGQMLCSVLW